MHFACPRAIGSTSASREGLGGAGKRHPKGRATPPERLRLLRIVQEPAAGHDLCLPDEYLRIARIAELFGDHHPLLGLVGSSLGLEASAAASSESSNRVAHMPGRTQDALYADIDLELSWSEEDLPQVERTKHVHSLHPYLGKFIPQLVEVFLHRYFAPGDMIFDPFVGSGTTLVEANVFGAPGVGCDISAFNCLLTRVKTSPYSLGELELDLRGALEGARRNVGTQSAGATPWLEKWFSHRALNELLAYRVEIERVEPAAHADVGRVILARAARSARMTTHFDLDFPRKPTAGPYYCHKHKRVCRPVDEAWKFLTRYTNDTVRRIREFAGVRTDHPVHVVHADSRGADLPDRAAGVITSPPYPGLIDYHEQHRYAYELLGLEDRRAEEIGAAASGRGRAALGSYVAAMSEVFGNAAAQLKADGRVLIVVNDSQGLYPRILENSGLVLEERITRHVNRRTGRRAGEFYEDVLVCRIA